MLLSNFLKKSGRLETLTNEWLHLLNLRIGTCIFCIMEILSEYSKSYKYFSGTTGLLS